MFIIPYADIVDISSGKRNLVVIEETTDRAVAEQALKGRANGDCEVYVEVGEKLYRTICKTITIKKYVEDAIDNTEK